MFERDALTKAILSWSRSDEAYEILDSRKNTRGCTWETGGCLPLAIALHDVLPGSEFAGVASRSGQIEHTGVLYRGGFFDHRGGRSPASVLRYWRREPNIELPLHIVTISDESIPDLCEAWGTCSTAMIHRLTKSLDKALPTKR